MFSIMFFRYFMFFFHFMIIVQTMPKPWHVSAFVTMLVRVMKIAQYSHKVDVAEALLAIHQQENIPNTEVVYKAIYHILGTSSLHSPLLAMADINVKDDKICDKLEIRVFLIQLSRFLP